MKQLDANTLVAYVDGELDLESAIQVERLLAEDADAQNTVRIFQETAVLVRAAHASLAYEPVPDCLVDVVSDAPETGMPSADTIPERLVNMILDAPEARPANSDGDTRPIARIAPARRRSVAAIAMAAAVSAVMLGSFYAGQMRMTALQERSNDATQASAISAINNPWREAAFQEALENKRSQEAVVWENPETGIGGAVIPVKTYRRADGTFCRAFRTVDTQARPTQPNFGVACREAGPEGRWIKTVEAIAAPGNKPELRY